MVCLRQSMAIVVPSQCYWRVEMDDVVIVSAGRTGVGKFGGALAKTAASDLSLIHI